LIFGLALLLLPVVFNPQLKAFTSGTAFTPGFILLPAWGLGIAALAWGLIAAPFSPPFGLTVARIGVVKFGQEQEEAARPSQRN
jgi:hypothetical protein